MARRSASKSANTSLPVEVREWLESELHRRGITDSGKLTAKLAKKLLAATGAGTESARHQCCSFCGKSRQEVKVLVAGHMAHICNECADLACHMINHEQK